MLFRSLLLLKASQMVKKKNRRRITPTTPSRQFKIENYGDNDCWIHFRFFKQDLLQLRLLLDIPDSITLSNGSRVDGITCFCVFLKRLCYPNRLFDLVDFFGLEYSKISRICSFMLNYINEKWKHLLDFPDHLLNQNYISMAKDKLGLDHIIIGFIDGTVRFIPRPTDYQRLMYNGHKRHHALKYQSCILWNGVIVHLSKVFEGKKHDIAILRESGLINKLEQQQERYLSTRLFVYGDPAYKVGRHILSPFKSQRNTEEENLFNTCMSSYRICVEWGFGKVIKDWAFLDFYKNLKLELQQVPTLYTVGVLLSNIRSCYYSNQTAMTFDIPCPTIEEYLNK